MKIIRIIQSVLLLTTFLILSQPILGSPTYETFTSDYVETDPNNHWTINTNNVTAANSLSNESDHMQKDFGASHFNGLNIKGAGIVYSGSENGIAVGAALTTNVTTDYSGFGTQDAAIVWRGDLGRAYFTRGVAADYDYLTITANVWYYWWITRTADSANVTCRFYSDDTYTTLLKTVTLTSFSTSTKWRYFYAFASYNGQGGGTSYWNGAFKNYDLNEVNAPSVSTSLATNTTNVTATLNGSLDALNGATSANVSFEYGTDTSYGTNTTAENISSLGAFSANISSLIPLTTYHFRAVGISDGGTGYGIDRTFLTSTSQTTVGALTLVPGLENIAVYSAFSDDNGGNNSATVQYKVSSNVTWISAPTAVADRRATISDDTGSLTNYFANQFRTVIFGLSENTTYDVKVTYTDADGFTGADNVTASVVTRTINPPATGNTYYVTKAGNDSTGDGSVGNPWLTIQKGVNSSVAGDTIKIGAGVYGEQVSANVSGTASNYIVIEAVDPVNKPNIDGGGARTYGIVVTGSYIKFKNLSVDNVTGDEGIDIDVQQRNGIIFDGIEVNGPSGSSQNSSGIRLYGSSSNCTIVNSTFTHAAHLGDEAAIFVKASDGQLRSQPTSITDRGGHVIKGNTFTGYWHDTISAYGNQSLYGGMPRNTFIYNNNFVSTGATDSDDVIEMDGENTNSAVFNNNIDASNGYKANLSIAGSYIGPNFIIGNVMDGVVHDGYPVKLAAGANQTGYVFFYHNTCYDPGDDGGGLVDAGGGGTNSNWYSYNNIYDSVSTYAVALMRAMDSSTGAFNYDIMIREGAGSELKWAGTTYTWAAFRAAYPALEVNGQNVDPLFTIPGSNFTLQASSPAVDNGTAIVGINDAGSLWAYSGTAPDIGAREYSPSSGPTHIAKVNGVLSADISSISGIPFANIHSVMGVD